MQNDVQKAEADLSNTLGFFLGYRRSLFQILFHRQDILVELFCGFLRLHRHSHNSSSNSHYHYVHTVKTILFANHLLVRSYIIKFLKAPSNKI
jgi:hypothetical protein